MRFLLYPNPTNAESCALAQTLEARLRALGHDACRADEAADMVAVLGGDGTVLRAVRTWHGLNKPFWLVNCGHLGYLSDCAAQEALPALEQILSGNYRLEYRTHLSGMLMGEQQVTALNELLFHRGTCVHTMQITVHVNGSLALKYRGDGLIVCTPSGSTAYNLSAGGPVLMPEMELLALTPICAQTLSVAPIVVSAHDRIRIAWHMGQREGMHEWPDLTADGQQKYVLPLDGTLEINAPLSRIALVRTRDANFYGRLQHRMHWDAE